MPFEAAAIRLAPRSVTSANTPPTGGLSPRSRCLLAAAQVADTAMTVCDFERRSWRSDRGALNWQT
jgi:hypothetical protein